jgi:hypothetical protein
VVQVSAENQKQYGWVVPDVIIQKVGGTYSERFFFFSSREEAY